MTHGLDKGFGSYYAPAMVTNQRLENRVLPLQHRLSFLEERLRQSALEDEKLLSQIQGVDFAVRQLNDHLALLMKHLGLAFDGRVRVVKEGK